MFASALVASILSFLGGAELGKSLGAYIFPDDAELYESYKGVEGTLQMLKDFVIALKDFFVYQWEDGVKRWKIILDTFKSIFETNLARLIYSWTSAWNTMKNTFTSIFNGIKSFFTGIINGISSGINKVTGGLRSISGGRIDLGTIPMMAEGGVLTSGTAIVGEAGPELVQVSNGEAMVQPLSGGGELTALLETYLPYLAAGTQLVMDSGALVGSIAPDMNMALGTIAIRGGRR